MDEGLLRPVGIVIEPLPLPGAANSRRPLSGIPGKFKGGLSYLQKEGREIVLV